MNIKRGIILFSLIILVAFFIFNSSHRIDAQATQPIPGTITLTWTDTSNTETGFYIERKTTSTSFAHIGTVNANIAQYTDTGVQQLTTYDYRVAAYNQQGQSVYSNTVQVTTPAFVCGNGILQNGEQCDDGNVVSGDGCSSTCTTESPSGGGGTGGSGGSGGGSSGGGGGISGNSVSTPPNNNNSSEENNPAPEQNNKNNNQPNQGASAGTTGRFIDGILNNQANIINIILFLAVVGVAIAVYFIAKKHHEIKSS